VAEISIPTNATREELEALKSQLAADINLSRNMSRWKSGVVRPYCDGYVKAFNRFKAILVEQDKQDKAMAEMFIMGAGIISRTVLMAVFANKSIETLAENAVKSIARNQLSTLFSRLGWTQLQEDNSLIFALGEAAREVTKKALKASEDKIRNAFKIPKISPDPDPQVVQNHMMKFVERAFEACSDSLEAIVKSEVSVEEKQSLVKKLRESPFNKPPENDLIEDEIKDQLELSFYLSAILNSAILISTAHAKPGPYIGLPVWEAGRRELHSLPGDPDWPKEECVLGGERTQVKYCFSVNFVSMPSLIRDRVDELHMKCLAGKFYADGSWDPYATNVHRENFNKAKRSLDALAEKWSILKQFPGVWTYR
jgi:hypothetical protein